MTLDALRVDSPGPLTTVQDLGRYGYQRFGVPVSGAMDKFALRAGNLMVGNRGNAAALEFTLAGPKLLVLRSCRVAVTGAEAPVELDGMSVPQWQAFNATAGSVLNVGTTVDGLRGYLCLSGGIKVPRVLGSRSTYLKSGFGGFKGRAVSQDDVIQVGRTQLGAVVMQSEPDPSFAPYYGNEHDVRVVLGPQHEAFTDEGKFTLLNSVYTVAPQSDRVGYRLMGPVIEHSGSSDIVSDGAPMGAVQVPGDGQPIVLMADRGVTGGYPKIATVISADLPLVAQARPDDSVRFRAVTVEEAEQIRWEQEAILHALAGFTEVPTGSSYSVAVGGASYEVVDADGRRLSLPPDSTQQAETAPLAVRASTGKFVFELEMGLRRSE